MSVTQLPHLNATLNAIAAVLLALGYRAIRRREVERHRRFMLAACATSIGFLASYLVYHAEVGSVAFTATGWIRPVYFGLLLTHVVLAAAVAPLVVMTLYRALRGELERHRRIARVTWPIWMYVSVTGVMVYVLLYHLFPPA